MTMGLFAILGSSIIKQFAEGLVGKITGAFEAYFQKQITEAQLKAQVTEAALQTFKEVEVSANETLAKTYASFMGAAANNSLIRSVWAAVVLSQLAVLLWHQVGIPAYVHFSGHSWPSSGTTVEWAYLLVAALCGLGPLVLRSGPGAASVGGIKSILRR